MCLLKCMNDHYPFFPQITCETYRKVLFRAKEMSLKSYRLKESFINALQSNPVSSNSLGPPGSGYPDFELGGVSEPLNLRLGTDTFARGIRI